MLVLVTVLRLPVTLVSSLWSHALAYLAHSCLLLCGLVQCWWHIRSWWSPVAFGLSLTLAGQLGFGLVMKWPFYLLCITPLSSVFL